MKPRTFTIALLVGTILAAGSTRLDVRVHAAAQSQAAQAVTSRPVTVSRALLDQYCVTCHNEQLKTAGVMFDKVDIDRVDAHRELFEKVARKLRKGQMPPQGRPQPDQAAVTAFVTALEAELDRVGNTARDPGRVVSHRMNRTEYVNVIRDLLALEIDGAALLPSDMAGFGFDNNADVLSMTPALMDRYIAAATKVGRLAVGTLENRTTIQSYKVPNSARQRGRMGEDMPFATHGGLAVRHTFSLDGDYLFKLRLRRGDVGETIQGNIAERQYEIELRIDHRLVTRLSVGGKFKGQVKYDLSGGGISVPEDDVVHQQVALYNQTADKDLEVRVPVKAGTRLVSAAFSDVAPSTSQGDGDNAPAGLDTLDIRGPYDGAIPEETPSRQRIFVCRPALAQDEKLCARRIIGTLARRAYRRPVTEADLLPLMKVYETGRAGGNFEAGIERALEALLSMPAFLIRAEAEPTGAKSGTIYRISDLELASRLAFFLWRSIPDDELLEAGTRGSLHEPAVLAEQTRRMLADRRATRWMNDFLGQWLQVRNLRTIEPDPVRFPDFDDTLREAMIKETELFFESQVRDDRSVLDLFRAEYTFLNARLAEHYGIPHVYGNHFRRMPVVNPARRGLLGHGSVLTVTSYADRTSVVLRGKWVLETLLGAPPPAPPPNVPPLKENDGKSKPVSLRGRMEQHRRNPVCASCHANMDPLGFALENFNAIGKWRDDDDGAPINSAITLRGTNIANPQAFREALLRQSDEMVRTVVEKLLTFALGRGLEYTDAPIVRQLVRGASRDDDRWSSVVLGIVGSAPFQQRIVRDVEQRQPGATRVAGR
ncbi:MAG: hypothetical protein DMF90_18900 [Acidobacteria bacterium]|nr:MAG: hypothetical protein DMF90_18900 [Acidobacteriota bacterium]